MNDRTEEPFYQHLAGHPPGWDPEDVYEDVDVVSLPSWWQQAIKEHDEHDLRPYRPPRFRDGELLPPLVEKLERELDVDIMLIGIDVEYEDEWTIRVDDENLAGIGKYRSTDGYSVFEMDSEEFSRCIRDYTGMD